MYTPCSGMWTEDWRTFFISECIFALSLDENKVQRNIKKCCVQWNQVLRHVEGGMGQKEAAD